MLHQLPQAGNKKTEGNDRFLTIPVIILLLLMMTFVGSGFYILISTFFN